MREGGALVDLEQERKQARSKPTRSEILELFTSRNLWAVYLGQYSITALTYFFITWFPIYLIKGRGMTLMQAGWVAALPAICGFTGGMLGGLLSDWLIRRGVHPSRARKTPFVIGYVVASTGSFNYALWFVAAHGVLGMVAYLLVAKRFERIGQA